MKFYIGNYKYNLESFFKSWQKKYLIYIGISAVEHYLTYVIALRLLCKEQAKTLTPL